MAEDLETIEKVLAGNQKAFELIVRQYESRVRGCCLALLSNFEQADEAAHEVFIKVYQSLGKFRRESSFSTWLYSITTNHCRDLLRKSTRQKTESWDALLEKSGEKIEARLLSSQPEENSMEQAEVVKTMLASLSEKSREVLILREVNGLSYQEISQMLSCSLDSVKARLKRARQELQKKFRHISDKNYVKRCGTK